MNQRVGRSSIRLAQPVCVIAGASIVGKKEGEGPLGTLFDMVGEDDLFGCKTWEEAESNLQKDAVYMVMEKAGWKAEDVSYLFAGDLLGIHRQKITGSPGRAGEDRSQVHRCRPVSARHEPKEIKRGLKRRGGGQCKQGRCGSEYCVRIPSGICLRH